MYNARTAARQHASIGYAEDRAVIVPNGFDTARFRPDPEARARTRAAWGVPDDAPVAG